MTAEKILETALNEMQLAAQDMQMANARYVSAQNKLAILMQKDQPKRKSSITDEQRARTLAKKNRRIKINFITK
jgi:hypothetical protein